MLQRPQGYFQKYLETDGRNGYGDSGRASLLRRIFMRLLNTKDYVCLYPAMAIFSLMTLYTTTASPSPYLYSSSSSSSLSSFPSASSPSPSSSASSLPSLSSSYSIFLSFPPKQNKKKNHKLLFGSRQEEKLPLCCLFYSSTSFSSSAFRSRVNSLHPRSCLLHRSSFHTEEKVFEASISDESETTEEKDIFLPSLCISIFLLQLSFVSETRRSFITDFLQHVSGYIAQRFSTQIPLNQTVTGVKPNAFARRVVLITPFLVTANAFCNNKSTAEEFGNPGNSFFQNLGLGGRDIYYPRVFEGSWVCNSTLISVDTPQGEDKVDKNSIAFSRKQLGYTLTYKARFIPFGNEIIGDRLFTTLSLVESTVGKDAVDHGIWTPKQPDRLTLILRGGRKVQNVVTKRSASLTGPGQFETSEYSQQVFDNSSIEGGPPTIKASQNRTRYRWDAAVREVSYIEAFQRVSMFPVIKEGFSNFDIMGMDKPIAVYKYLVRFTREPNVSHSTP